MTFSHALPFSLCGTASRWWILLRSKSSSSSSRPMSLKKCFFKLFISWFCVSFFSRSMSNIIRQFLRECWRKSSSSCSSRLLVCCETARSNSGISTLFSRVWTFFFSNSTVSFNEAILSALINFLAAPDRFGRVGVSALVVGDVVDCFDGYIFDFASEAFGEVLLFFFPLSDIFKVDFKFFCFVMIM